MDNIVVLSSNSYTNTNTNVAVPIVSALSSPAEVTVLNEAQLISNSTGTATQYWALSGSVLYPTTATNAVVVGGTSLVSTEMLRVVGKLNATSISLGTDAYGLYTSGGELYFKDTLVTKKLSDFGGVSSVSAGDGLNFTTITGTGSVTLGTPSAITSTSTSAVAGTTHSHAIDATIVNTGATYANPSWLTSVSEAKVLPTQTGNSGKYLKTNGTVSSWSNISLSDDIFYFSGTSYTPYSASASGKFDNSATAPSAVSRLNYNGDFYATSLYGNHVINGTSGDLAYTNGTKILTGIGNWNGTTLTVAGNMLSDVVYVDDVNTSLSLDGSNNLVFTDANAGSVTLSTIASATTNYWTGYGGGLYYVGNVAIGGTTFTGTGLTVTGAVYATNFDSSKYRWRNNNICIGTNAGDNELNSDKVYIDKTDTANPMLYGDLDLRYWTFNGDTYWGVGKKQYFSSTTNSVYADATDNLTFKDGVAASGVAIKLVNLIDGTYNALKSDFTSYATATAITATNVSNWNTAYTKSSIIDITGSGTHFLGADGLYRPLSATVALYDNILQYDTVNGWYKPYTTKAAGVFYNTDATMPSNTNQLKYDGYLYATRLYSDDLLTNVLNTSGGTKTAGYFYTGTTDPTSSNRLNYDGYLYAYRAYAARIYTTDLIQSGLQIQSVVGVDSGVLSATTLQLYNSTTTDQTSITNTAISISPALVQKTHLNPAVANGSTAIAYLFDTSNALSTTGAKIASWKNNNVEKAYIDKDGKIGASGILLSGLTASKVMFTDASSNATSTGIGTSAQFIKGDGSLDSFTYLTSSTGVSSGTIGYAAVKNTTTITVQMPSSSTVYDPGAGLTALSGDGITASAADNNLRIGVGYAGVYWVGFKMDLTCTGTSSGNIVIKYGSTGGATSNINATFLNDGTQTFTVADFGFISLNDNDYIKLYTSGNTVDASCYSYTLFAFRIR